MAVTNNATLIEDMEGAGPTITGIGGGKGASLNTDIFIAGSQSVGRRSDNVTNTGMWVNPGATFDLSGTGEHVKMFLWVTQDQQVTAASLRIGPSTTVYETHTITVAEWPALGGWFPVWVEVDSGTDTGSPAFTAADEFGYVISIGNVGGNADNHIFDQIHHSARPVLTWDGSTGAFSDFVTTSDTNALAVLIDINGALNLYANVQIGSATATTFTDSGVVVLAPDWSHLPTGSTWTGIDIDLQNASTVVTWTGSVFGASDITQTRKPDLVVTGTSGTADLSNNRFQGLRLVDFTDAVTCNGSVFDQCGIVDLTTAGTNGADVSKSQFLSPTGTTAVLWNVNADPDGELDGCLFESDGSSHAMEFGASSPATITLRDQTYTSYAGVDGSTGNEVFYNNSGGAMTVNVIGATGTFSVRNGAGASTTVVVNPVTLTITCQDAGSPIQGVRVLVLAADGTGPLPFGDSVTIAQTSGTATATHTAHGLATGQEVLIAGANQDAYNGLHTITVTTANAYTFTVPSGTTSPATGTIVSTGVVIDGLTNASGVISDTRSYSADQPITGNAAKGTVSPVYVQAPISGDIDSAAGLSITVPMTRDD